MKFKLFGYWVSIEKQQKTLAQPSERRSGRSTRLIDMHIQTLFNTGEVKVFDHYPTRQADNYLFKDVLRRLSIEHGLTDKQADIDKNKFVIRLKNNGKGQH